MTDTLFSEFLMVDRVVARPSGRTPSRSSAGRLGGTERSPTEENLREAFSKAFLQAVELTVPAKAELAERSAAELAELAAAFADIAVGGSVVLRLKPDLAEGQRGAVRTFLEILVRVSETLEGTRLETAIGKLAEVILPDELADARGALASDNLELRDRFISETPQLTSAEVGVRAGHQTKNPYASAARWKKSGDIFSVHHRGTEYFPAFQFRDGRPHPTVKKVLAALPNHLSAWQRAFWFVSTNGWLDDKSPAAALDDVNAMVAAAKHESQEVVG